MTTTLAKPQTADAERTAPQRHVLLDAARFFAVLSIVWLHVPRSPELRSSAALGRFAVPFFTAAAVFFVIQSLVEGRRRTLVEYARNRIVRLYVPCLAWTAIYLLFKIGKWALTPNQPNDFPGIAVVFTGGFYHLWFLPYVLMVTLATFVVGRGAIGNERREARFAWMAAAIGTAIAVGPVPHDLAAFGAVVEYGWMALPAAFWAVPFAILYRRKASQFIERAAMMSGLGVTVIATAWTLHVGRSMFAENVAGISFLIFTLGKWEGPWVRRLSTFGPLAYGIYLSHLLFIKTCEAVGTKLHWQETVCVDLATFAIAAIGSTFLAWTLSRGNWTRWMVA